MLLQNTKLARQALAIDAKRLSPSDPKGFEQANYTQYNIAIDMWMSVMVYGTACKYFDTVDNDFTVTATNDRLDGQFVEDLFYLQITKLGLCGFISYTKQVASDLITGRSDLPPAFKFMSHLDITDIYSRLVFLKRFSVSHSEVLSHQCAADFLTIEEEVAKYQSDVYARLSAPCTYNQLAEIPHWIRDLYHIGDRVHSGRFLPYDVEAKRILHMLTSASIRRPANLSFNTVVDCITSGAARNSEDADTNRIASLPANRLALAANTFGITELPYGDVPCVPLDSTVKECCFFSSVPKDSTKYRGIAVNNSLRTFEMKYLVHEWRKELLVPLTKVTLSYNNKTVDVTRVINSIRKNLGETTQDLSRRNLYYNAAKIATIDQKAASDYASPLAFRAMFGDEVLRYVNSVRAHYIMIEGHKKRLSKLTTMGDGWCFLFETLMFTTLSILATLLTATFNDWSEKRFLTALDRIVQFGDDAELDYRVADTFMDLSTIYGFKVNYDKSFASGIYREACGAEWFDGTTFQTVKWPRHPLYANALLDYNNNVEMRNLGNNDSFCIDLVNLQHKFASNPMITAAISLILQDVCKYQPGLSYDGDTDRPYDFWTSDAIAATHWDTYYHKPVSSSLSLRTQRINPADSFKGKRSVWARSTVDSLRYVMSLFKYNCLLADISAMRDHLLDDPLSPVISQFNIDSWVTVQRQFLTRVYAEIDDLSVEGLEMLNQESTSRFVAIDNR